MMKAIGLAVSTVLSAGLPMAASAQVAIADCPNARMPYTSASPLIDIRNEPAAMAVIEREAPAAGQVARAIPAGLNAIMSVKMALRMASQAQNDGRALDAALAKVPVSAEAMAKRCARYDNDRPALPKMIKRPAILVFDKINGFRDVPSVNAATQALKDMAARRGWSIQFSDKGGAINGRDLARFDAVVWNNVSGDVLTLSQRKALRDYVTNGGGFAAMHGSAGDPVYYWDWYADTLIGAHFMGHSYQPQFQTARVVVAEPRSSITQKLPTEWSMNEEWYSFARSPRETGAHVLATLDESSYSPVGFGGNSIRMGKDHPIAWTRCVGNGRSFYSAIGHRPESYKEPNSDRLLEQGIAWAIGKGDTRCVGGKEVIRK
ncbi:ThuA domain-containing protein [Sphingobium tyrosinilyticum]|uniref:ThuA domain-containing protein n=1 Tax=Sphingobium tyrosinilyticum TaxID=2715436 RepID=A0ABV9F3I7_9SPHN